MLGHYLLFPALCCQSHVLPLTVDNLNTTKFTPRKDYALNRLTSGVLQLSANTHLLIDETVMAPGQLDSRGQCVLMHGGSFKPSATVVYEFEATAPA